MTLVLQGLDASGNLIVDFNDDAGTNNEGIRTNVRDINSGEIPQNLVTFSGTYPGGQKVHSRAGLRMWSWSTMVRNGGSADGIRAFANKINRYIEGGGDGRHLKFQASSSSEVLYIDFLGSEALSGLLRGQELGVLKTFVQFHDPEGIPVVIVAQPFLRGAELDSDTNKLKNSTLLFDSNGDGKPDEWTVEGSPSATSINAATESARWTAAAEFDGYSQGNVVASPGQVWTASAELARISGTRLVAIELRFEDSGGGNLLSTSSTGISSSAFTRASATATAPALTTKVKMFIDVRGGTAGSTDAGARRAQLEQASTATTFVTSTEIVSNDPAGLGRFYPVFIDGDAPTPVSFGIKGDAGAFIQAAHMASLSALEEGGKSLARFLNSPPVIQCEAADITNITDVHAGPNKVGTIVADTEASNGQAVSYSSSDGRLLRFDFTDTDALEGFRGTFEWKLRLTTIENWTVELQLRWADSLEQPASFANLPVRHNTELAGLSSFGYVEVNLGKTALPTEGTLDGLALEVWARSITSSASPAIRVDCLIAVPTEQSASVSLPYTGRAVVSENSTQAELGNQLGANTWRATWRYSIQAPTPTFVIALRIRRDTQDSGTIVREFQKAHPNDISNVTASLEFDSLAAVTYFADTDTFAGSATITVHEIIIEKVGGVEENETLFTDPNLGVDRAYKLATTGRRTSPAYVAGPMPFWLSPGLSLVYVDVSEPRIGGLYSELKSELGRNPTLSHSYSPRYPA